MMLESQSGDLGSRSRRLLRVPLRIPLPDHPALPA